MVKGPVHASVIHPKSLSFLIWQYPLTPSIQMVVTALNNLSAWVNKMVSVPLSVLNRMGIHAQVQQTRRKKKKQLI